MYINFHPGGVNNVRLTDISEEPKYPLKTPGGFLDDVYGGSACSTSLELLQKALDTLSKEQRNPR